MIKSVEITNFQSHKSTAMDFHPGVNIIKGRSHSGKSSIIRALKWAILNRPVGFHFKSHFSGNKDETTVAVEFDDDSFIVRTKGTGINEYRGSGIKGKLEAIRSDVPEEISAITQMNEINILEQGDPYFMLQETPGNVAKMLNTIVGLDIIDETMSKINSIINTAVKDTKYKEQELIKTESDLESLVYVDDVKPLIDEISKLITKEESLDQTISSLSRKIEELEEVENTIQEIDEWLTIEGSFLEIKGYLESFSRFQSQEQALKNMIADISKAETSLRIANETLDLKIQERAELLKSTENEFCKTCGAHQSHWRK
jgi:exonuclease SbcC